MIIIKKKREEEKNIYNNYLGEVTKVKRLANLIIVCRVIHHLSTQKNEFGGELKGIIVIQSQCYLCSPSKSFKIMC